MLELYQNIYSVNVATVSDPRLPGENLVFWSTFDDIFAAGLGKTFMV